VSLLAEEDIWEENDDKTKLSSTPALIHLGSVHGPIAALRAQP
jgi:hypothetical protein